MIKKQKRLPTLSFDNESFSTNVNNHLSLSTSNMKHQNQNEVIMHQENNIIIYNLQPNHPTYPSPGQIMILNKKNII